MVIDKSKSKASYEYKEQVKVLFSGVVRKYKKNNGDLVENVEVVVQHDQKSRLVYMLVRLIATKHPIFTGYVLKEKSTARVLNKKDENLEVGIFILHKDKPAELNRVKLQL